MANQTIIQAAGQRYAPTKIDYSGYIQGIASITSALVEKRKKNLKKNETFGKLAMNAKHPNLENNLIFMRDKLGRDTEGMVLVQDLLEQITQNNKSLEDPKFLKKLTQEYEGMSLSVDLKEQHYWNTMLSSDFSDKRQIIVGKGVVSEIEVDGEMKESTTYTTLDNLLESGVYNENEIIEIIKKEGLRDVIMGADGNYIDVEDFQSTIRTKINYEDSGLVDEINKTIVKLTPERESTAADKNPDQTWKIRKANSLNHIKNMVNQDEDLLLSAMTDITYSIKPGVDLVPSVSGSEDNFMDWILATDLDFSSQWNVFLETEEGQVLSGEVLERTKAQFIIDLYKSDNKLVDDYMEFIEAVYDSYY